MLTTITEPTEGIYLVERNVQAFVGEKCLGKGPLYVSEDYLSWCDALSAKGFSLEYPNISLHAVSKDTSHFPYECVFCMVEGAFEDELEDREDSENEDDPPSAEIRFVPDNASSLNDIYTAICDCQVLHPDEQEQLEDEMAGYPFENGDEYFTNEVDASVLSEDGQTTLDRLENVFQIQSQQDFASMTDQTNGNVNGHEKVDHGQFDDKED
ncbi:methylosome subunit pICln-like [Xenia sp. Carnegie-2017]|uniref:methylosome subunit pICln-like n=1 Tax=Xenia sp. Carnegie-2017 TaxID=2897299 RepID=UPI001F047DF0|nr:methylosome subunit pICln-like [Xenia sp. Carnegie-2017]